MAIVFNEQIPHDAGFILSEANGQRSRENIVVASSSHHVARANPSSPSAVVFVATACSKLLRAASQSVLSSAFHPAASNPECEMAGLITTMLRSYYARLDCRWQCRIKRTRLPSKRLPNCSPSDRRNADPEGAPDPRTVQSRMTKWSPSPTEGPRGPFRLVICSTILPSSNSPNRHRCAISSR